MACAMTLDARAARPSDVLGPGVSTLSMSLSRRSMRREIDACGPMSSAPKSLNALKAGA